MKKEKILLYASFVPYVLGLLKILITGELDGYISSFGDLFFHNSVMGIVIFNICFGYQIFYFVNYTRILPTVKTILFFLSIISLIIISIVFIVVAFDDFSEAIMFLMLVSVLPIFPPSLIFFISTLYIHKK